MKPKDRVITEFGPGTILFQEGKTGVFSHRYCVKLDYVPEDLRNIHNKYNGVFFYDNKMKVLKEKPKESEQGELWIR